MRSIVPAAVLTGSILMSCGGSLSAASPTVACELVTQARVSAALGVTVGAGTPIARPGTCQWAGKGRIATLTITQPLAGKTPVEQFNAGKTSKRYGITMEPVSGVGDDAFYVFFATNTPTAAVGIVVRKGDSTFEVRVYGFPLEEGKTVGKSLAQDVAGKF
jgi:hypothetical protein